MYSVSLAQPEANQWCIDYDVPCLLSISVVKYQTLQPISTTRPLGAFGEPVSHWLRLKPLRVILDGADALPVSPVEQVLLFVGNDYGAALRALSTSRGSGIGSKNNSDVNVCLVEIEQEPTSMLLYIPRLEWTVYVIKQLHDKQLTLMHKLPQPSVMWYVSEKQLTVMSAWGKSHRHSGQSGADDFSHYLSRLDLEPFHSQ